MTFVKKRIRNIFLSNGESARGEKLLGKSFKLIQKVSKKTHLQVIRTSLVESTPIFSSIIYQSK